MKLTKKQQKIHRSIHKASVHIFVTGPFLILWYYAIFRWNTDDVFDGAPVKDTGPDFALNSMITLIIGIMIFAFNYATHHKFVDEDYRRRSEGRYKYNPKKGRTRELTGNENL